VNESPRDREILALNQAMLESVVAGDWTTYASFCSEDLTCFEAETNGVLAQGLSFHQFYFNLPAEPSNAPAGPTVPANVSMAGVKVRWMSDDAVILSYTLLTQKVSNGEPITASCCETRAWQKLDGNWKQVHVHRS
jgi:calcium/calmodulin-dependent protein kinase (CaM kinase) II